MQKDFEGWGKFKPIINNRELMKDDDSVRTGCYPREIWICSIGINVGSETDGKNMEYARPILIFKVFNSEMFWGIPLTTTHRVGKFYYNFNLGGVDNTAMLSQMRPLSAKRLDRKITTMPGSMFKELRAKLIELL